MVASAGAAGAAARFLPRGAGLGTAAGVLYAAGDVGTKAALAGGERLLFVPALLACHGAAFGCMQFAFQRGSRLTTDKRASPSSGRTHFRSSAGTLLFGEGIPVAGAAWRVAAFALVLVGAAQRREAPPPRVPQRPPKETL